MQGSVHPKKKPRNNPNTENAAATERNNNEKRIREAHTVITMTII
jgi:hypothetical protein